MSTIYLYHKLSLKGLNYLGITRQNPFKYQGSGKYWKLHLKKHNLTTKDITTVILFESFSLEDIRKKGLYYSELWDVVNDNNWANLIPESGDGCLSAKFSENHRNKIRLSRIGRKETEQTKERKRIAMTGKKATQETRDKISKSNIGKLHGEMSDITKEKIRISKLGRCNGVKVISKLTKEIYQSVKEAAEKNNLNASTLRSYLRYYPSKCDFEYLTTGYPKRK